MNKQERKDIASFAIEKAHSIECPILTGCTINSLPMEELAKMTRWFSFISKDMAKEIYKSGRNLDNRQLGLYFQYSIDKAVEITYLATCGADWTDVDYCADDAWEYWEPKTDVCIQQRLTANVSLIVKLFNFINDEFQLRKDELEQNELNVPADEYMLVMLCFIGSTIGVKWMLEQEFE